jgi:hypothetical protein
MKNKGQGPEGFATSLGQTTTTSQRAEPDTKPYSGIANRKPKKERAKLQAKEVMMATRDEDEDEVNQKKIREAIEELKMPDINETNFIHVDYVITSSLSNFYWQ